LQVKENESALLMNSKLTEKERLQIKKDSQEAILNEQLEGLRKQKEFAEQEGKDTLDLDKAIREKQLEIQAQYIQKEIDAEKEKQEKLKAIKSTALDI